MGRRALPKIDPHLDLSRHLRTVEQLPRPWDGAAIFDRHAPLELEAGSGKGLFLAGAAAANPDLDYLGVERARKYAQFAASRLAKRDLANACVVHGDVLALLRDVVPDTTLAAVHVYFPDPWWKARHKKRRVMNESFLADIQRALKPEGRLHFWTDVEEYFHATLALVAACTSLAGPLEVAQLSPQHDLDYRTHFERRTRLSGLPVYRAEFVKP